MGGVGRQFWARGPIPIFRKIHLYGKIGQIDSRPYKKKTKLARFSGLGLFRGKRLPWSY
jgi:hypothetical protein